MKTRSFALPVLLLPALLFLLAPQSLRADDITWNLNAATSDWHTAANWTPATVPGEGDTATFSVSNQTDVSVSEATSIGTMVFYFDASAYRLTCAPGVIWQFEDGISNVSGQTQTFVVAADNTGNGAYLEFVLSALAGDQTNYTVEGAALAGGSGGLIQLTIYSEAQSATFTNEGGTVAGAGGGQTQFYQAAQADKATITNKAGIVSGATGGVTLFTEETPTAGNAHITCEGATVSGAGGGLTDFQQNASADSATLIALGGTNGGAGGQIIFEDAFTSRAARLEVFGNGQMDASRHGKHPLTLGSVEGDGLVYLGANNLAVGSSNLSTTYSGTIQDGGVNGGRGGSLTKLGSGTLTVSGASTYTGGTTVSAGTLVVSNMTGSATGTGRVNVNAGTLGGSGIISGAVTMGTGSGSGAFLAPAHGAQKQATLTIESGLTLQADATYTYTFKARGKKARTDKVVANGVTINGATFAFQGTVQGTLKQGLVLAAISNMSATPITGTFANLADGAILTVNGNNFQASYEGGDGNDLTLTVVP